MAKPKIIEAGCPQCEASGFHGEDPIPANNPFCPKCKGRGKISVPADQSAACPECNGKGHVENVPCKPCANTGRIVPQAPEPPEKPPAEDPRIAQLASDLADARAAIKVLRRRLCEAKAEPPAPDSTPGGAPAP